MVFTIYGHGGHLGHVTKTIWTNFRSRVLRSLHMKFELYWPSGFRGEDVWNCGRTDGRRTTDGRRSDWYTISSPMSLRLRWAKKTVVSKKKIHYSCEGRIEKSVPRYHRLSSLCKPPDAKRRSSGWIFLSYLHTHNRFLYSMHVFTFTDITEKQTQNNIKCWKMDKQTNQLTNRRMDKNLNSNVTPF